MAQAIAKAIKGVLKTGIRAYQYFLSPFLGQNCRFYPSCSVYAQEAIETHGALKGSVLAVKRIACCNPFHPGGFDPVPPKQQADNEKY